MERHQSRSMIERSVSYLLLLLIFIFALNSTGNVQKFVGRYHEHWTGSVLGIAFGSTVFLCAYISATSYGSTRWVSIAIGTIFGIASAQFQTELYASEGMELTTALALSYIPIVAGEMGLALLEALYSTQRKELREPIANKTSTSNQLPLSERLEPVLEREYGMCAAESTAGKVSAGLKSSPAKGKTESISNKTVTRPKKQERQTKLLTLLANVESEDNIDPSALASQVSASIQTIYRDLSQLKGDGRLKIENGKVIVV